VTELLKVDNVSMIFGGLRAVSNLDMYINDGELVGFIGPNGAGKTTAFNMLTGVYEPSEGLITFDGKKVNGKKPYQVTAMGMARTFQNIRLFSELTVIDNVKIAYNMHVQYSLGEAIARVGRYFKEEEAITQKALDLLKIFNLEDKANELAKNLPYGEQRRLEIARAMATEPKLLLLDEPAAGMNPQETQELMQMIRWIRDEFKLTILLIEHDMNLVMGVCERIYVLEYGICIATGKPDEIKADKNVIRAYLGEEVMS
jgi:branched-chain amino acid transport system ATP-binding protein